jgi:hypothetical protein
MSKPVAATLLVLAATTIGCINEHHYIDPGQGLDNAWGSGAAAIRGEVGQVRDIDSLGRDIAFQSDARWVNFSGNVPHQRSQSSVFVQVDIQNAHLLPIGGELHQGGTGDVYSATEADGPVLSVYICPNGEGLSGNADDIVVKRVGRESFTFIATSSIPEQNLDIDLGVGSEAEADVLQAELLRPAPGAGE